MKLKLTLISVILLSSLCFGQSKGDAVEVMDLNRAMDLALKNNSDLLSVRQDLIIAESRVKEAVFRFFPQISFSSTITKSELEHPVVFSEEFSNHYLSPTIFENFYTFRTHAVQTLYSGGRNKNTLRLARASLKQTKTEYEKIKREIELRLKKAFYELLCCEKLYQVISQWNSEIDNLSKRIRLNAWDRIELKKLKSELIFDLDFAEKEIKQKKLQLIKALNKETNTEINITGKFQPSDTELKLEQAIFWAMERRPELKSQVYSAQMDEISLHLAMSRRAPTISLSGTYDYTGHKFPLNESSWYTTLAVHFPLSFDLWTQVQQRRAEVRKGDLKRANIQDEIKIQVRCAYNDLVFWQNAVKYNFETYNELNNDFKNAVRNSSINISAIRSALSVYKTQIKYLMSVKNQLIGNAQIEWVLGCEIPCR